MLIRDLFDPGKNIYRPIEKVITYGAAQEQRIKAEISEYVVTKSIDEQTEDLLRQMQTAMEAGDKYEVGVWVAGFYGSGKSSFTKYLGLAFDDKVQVDGQPFLKALQDRYHQPKTKALLGTITKRFPAAVVLLDLASAQVAGATLEVVSTVLYYKVLQWAGYSRNLKVAALERRLKKDGRHNEFQTRFRDKSGEEWHDYQNDPLVIDSLVPELAHELYPGLFPTAQSFTTETSEFITLLDDRVREILDIVRETSGKDYVLFVIDEIGQYVGRGAANSYEIGILRSTPAPRLSREGALTLAALAQQAWQLKYEQDRCNESSHAFLLPAYLHDTANKGVSPCS